jgi:hypothetical protein
MRRIFVVAIFLGVLPFLGMVAIEQSSWKSKKYCTANEGPMRIHNNVWFPIMFSQK